MLLVALLVLVALLMRHKPGRAWDLLAYSMRLHERLVSLAVLVM